MNIFIKTVFYFCVLFSTSFGGGAFGNWGGVDYETGADIYLDDNNEIISIDINIPPGTDSSRYEDVLKLKEQFDRYKNGNKYETQKYSIEKSYPKEKVFKEPPPPAIHKIDKNTVLCSFTYILCEYFPIETYPRDALYNVYTCEDFEGYFYDMGNVLVQEIGDSTCKTLSEMLSIKNKEIKEEKRILLKRKKIIDFSTTLDNMKPNSYKDMFYENINQYVLRLDTIKKLTNEIKTINTTINEIEKEISNYPNIEDKKSILPWYSVLCLMMSTGCHIMSYKDIEGAPEFFGSYTEEKHRSIRNLALSIDAVASIGVGKRLINNLQIDIKKSRKRKKIKNIKEEKERQIEIYEAKQKIYEHVSARKEYEYIIRQCNKKNIPLKEFIYSLSFCDCMDEYIKNKKYSKKTKEKLIKAKNIKRGECGLTLKREMPELYKQEIHLLTVSQLWHLFKKPYYSINVANQLQDFTQINDDFKKKMDYICNKIEDFSVVKNINKIGEDKWLILINPDNYVNDISNLPEYIYVKTKHQSYFNPAVIKKGEVTRILIDKKELSNGKIYIPMIKNNKVILMPQV